MSNLGYTFEASEVDFWRMVFPCVNEDYIYRVEGSGRSKNATKTGQQSLLEGDVSVELAKALILPKDLLIECKHRKSRTVEKSVSVQKEWVDQALHEAEKNGRWSVVAIKFKGVHPNSVEYQQYCWADGKFGNSIHYIIPQRHFADMLRYIEEIKSGTKVDLAQVSTEDLLAEIVRRTQRG